MNSAIAAIIGLALAIVLIIRKIPPVFALFLGALAGGLLAGWGMVRTVSEMISGVKDIVPAIVRILAAGAKTWKKSGTCCASGSGRIWKPCASGMNENILLTSAR